jgi:hypothetical protein
MRNPFRSFDRFGVEYLLISGQACILYGASEFSEDVDIWTRPTASNAANLMRALAACDAVVHKLTPPMTPATMRRGHGYHYKLPDVRQPLFLDVMPRPPRVGPFAAAARRARRMQSLWGPVRVVAVSDLIELKKTRRLADYDVITNLVRLALEAVHRPAPELLRWAAANAFDAEVRAELLGRLGRRPSVEQCRRAIGREIAQLQAADTAHWRRRIADLRRWRRERSLLVEGTPVRALLAR